MRIRLDHHQLAVLSADPEQPWLSHDRMVWAGLMYEGNSPRYCSETHTQWFIFSVVDEKLWLRALLSTGVKAESLW